MYGITHLIFGLHWFWEVSTLGLSLSLAESVVECLRMSKFPTFGVHINHFRVIGASRMFALLGRNAGERDSA